MVKTLVNQVKTNPSNFKLVSKPQITDVEAQVTALWNRMYPGELRPKVDVAEFFSMFPKVQESPVFYKSYYLYLKHKKSGERYLTISSFNDYTKVFVDMKFYEAMVDESAF